MTNEEGIITGATADFSGTNFTFNSGTSNIQMGTLTYIYEVDKVTFIGAGRTFYDVKLQILTKRLNTGGGFSDPKIILTGSNTYRNLELNSTWYVSGSTIKSYVSYIILSENQTVTGTFTTSSTTTSTAETRLYITPSTLVTITAANVSLLNVDFKNITGSGTATWTGTRIGNQGGNSNISFTVPRNLYWINGAGAWTTFSHWALTSGGTGGERLPLPQDNVFFDANSFSANNQQITTDFVVLGNDILVSNLSFNPIFYGFDAGVSDNYPISADSLTIQNSVQLRQQEILLIDFVISNAPITVSFVSSFSFITTGTFTANGSLGNLITLTASGSVISNISANTASVSYVVVDHNTALGNGIPFDDRIGGVDSGNNTNWLFAAGATWTLSIFDSINVIDNPSPQVFSPHRTEIDSTLKSVRSSLIPTASD